MDVILWDGLRLFLLILVILSFTLSRSSSAVLRPFEASDSSFVNEATGGMGMRSTCRTMSSTLSELLICNCLVSPLCSPLKTGDPEAKCLARW